MDYAQDSFRRLVLESLDKHTGIGFTRKSSHMYTYILRNHIPKILCILLTQLVSLRHCVSRKYLMKVNVVFRATSRSGELHI